ncbi:hypothetical protein ACIQTT_12480 [Microbacterium sp. NPDC090225]|uniref:hypothetical protein n=1 Tax=Microbacterium sp. NPDC090225 TaxID=3364207 RepID=UPI0037F9F31E
MDEIERRIRHARPASGHRDLPLTDRAKRELGELIIADGAQGTARQVAFRRRRRAWVFVPAAAAAVAVAVVVGTIALWPSSAPEALTPTPTPATASTGTSATSSDAMRALADGTSYDFIPHHSNEELAETADVVVSGSVVKIQPGPTYGRFDDDFSDMETVVVTITASTVAKGDIAEGAELNVVLYTSAHSDLDAWNAALPEGTGVAVYLTKMSSERPAVPEDSGIDAEGLEAFEGIDLYATGPQGFAVQTEGNTILWPWTDVTRDGSINEALPGGSAVGVLTAEEAAKVDVED